MQPTHRGPGATGLRPLPLGENVVVIVSLDMNIYFYYYSHNSALCCPLRLESKLFWTLRSHVILALNVTTTSHWLKPTTQWPFQFGHFMWKPLSFVICVGYFLNCLQPRPMKCRPSWPSIKTDIYSKWGFPGSTKIILDKETAIVQRCHKTVCISPTALGRPCSPHLNYNLWGMSSGAFSCVKIFKF